jgi:hypothetical protein
VVANCGHLSKLKYSSFLPYAFTEHGAIMAANVLNSPRAIKVSVYIVRVFVKLRQMIAENKELSRKIVQIERHLADHDEQIIELDNIKKSEKLLKDSKSIITSLDLTTKNKVFDKVILDLNSMINEVITSLDENSKLNTYNKMKTLGEHVNLMLSRGDLVLSGIEFEK